MRRSANKKQEAQEFYSSLTSDRTDQSFVSSRRSPLFIRILKAVDLFSFIPVPKGDQVSTNRSLIGSSLFFIIFISYILYDFISYALNNPAIVQNSLTRLSQEMFELPRFAVTFMQGDLLNQTQTYERYMKFKLTQQVKNPGEKYQNQIPLDIVDFENSTEKDRPKYLQWMGKQTMDFYRILRIPSKSVYGRGLLYSTSNATYGKITVTMCDFNNNTQDCKGPDQIKKLLAGGRIFLFVQEKADESSASLSLNQEVNPFTIYNFFLIPEVYKRVIITVQIQKQLVMPDYLWRFTQETHTRLMVKDINEQTSNVRQIKPQNQTALQLIGINFQLHPDVLNIRVSYTTLIDRVAMWGAFWGVLFSVFAFLFLTHNRKKFYKKNPEWDQFKKYQRKIINNSGGTFINSRV